MGHGHGGMYNLNLLMSLEYKCTIRPRRSIARFENDDGKCNMKIIRLKSKLGLIS